MKASLAKGTRDFLPHQARRRKYIFEIIEKTFCKFAYQPLETPAMENLETLMGKYGDEGDKLLFKILNSGDYLKDTSEQELLEKNTNNLLRKISEKGLRYDLTVPFARVVAMNQHLISLPFKRYQIQPVWRADRPQRGRYREFYQCDADVVGSPSLYYEIELMQIYDQVFTQLGIPVRIIINHRAILESIAIEADAADRFMDITIILDKLDKVGQDTVRNELLEKNISNEKVNWILSQIKKSNLSEFEYNDKAKKGSHELKKVIDIYSQLGFTNELVFDCSLARGLSYYTGCIFEVIPTQIKMGSLGGGGRYDNLTGVFGLNGVSGVGISFGADRIYDVMEEMQIWPKDLDAPIHGLIMCSDEESLDFGFQILHQLRALNVKVDMYPEAAKAKKQFKYAEDLHVQYAILIDAEGKKSGIVRVKNITTGAQTSLKINELESFFKQE